MRSSAYDFTDISSSNSGNPQPEEAQETILADVPEQVSHYSRRSVASTLSQHDKELRFFPLAMISKSFFFVATAMFLWLSIDDLYWADDARTIPTSVLEADDDLTWRQFRSRQSGRTVGDSDASEVGYSRTSTAGNYGDEGDEITWSDVRNAYGLNNDDDRRYLRSGEVQPLQAQRRQQDEAGVSFQTPWNELSFSLQIAAATLGHDATSWNQGLPVFTDTIRWSDLTPEQQEAAVSLGYNQDLWDMLRGFSSTTDPNTATATNAVDPATDQDWGQFFWNELPEEIRTEAAKLGYDETLWNEGGRTFADDLFWDQLTEEQQNAAAVLGYSKETWDVYSEPVVTPLPTAGNPAPAPPPVTPALPPTSSSSTNTGTSPASSPNLPEPVPENTVDWRAFEWGDLPTEIRGGAIALGFTETLWNSGAGVATDQYFWDELSNSQQKAANTIFGYTEITWNASNNKWQKIAWDNLPPSIQSSAATLGYSEALWNSGASIDTAAYTWGELSGEQQQAAYRVFGLTEQSWAGAALKEEEEGDVKNKGGGRGGGRGGADDDYVFSVGDEEGNNEIWVSKYQIVYFVASFCFIVVGVLDMIRELRAFHVLMVLAGIFSLLSAVWVETSLATSNIFHCFSMHFFLFQGIATLFYRRHLRNLLPGPCKNALWMGDISFICGALMHSILSYFYFKDDARENLHIARADSFAALLFFLTAAIYIAVTPIAFIRNTKHKPYR